MTAEHPEDWSADVDEDDLRAALAAVENEASDHNAEYAAGMRNARLIVEEELST